MAAARPPLDVRLQIVKQESVTHDVSFVNGQTKVVHSCIKGSPFKLELALVGNFDRSIINFNRFVITAVLLYDYADGGRGVEERQVSFVKTRPLEVLEYSVNDAGDRLTLVVVLHVLSSQHEHSLFLIKIANADLGLVAVSQPIRVVSKELQLKGKAKPRQATSSGAASSAASRRPLTEEVVQYLQRIEAQSETHHQLLLSILQRLAAADGGGGGMQPQPQQQQRTFSGEGVPGEPAAKRQKRDFAKDFGAAAAKSEGTHNNNAAEGSAPSFEESFATLVRSFGALPREQRTETVRRTVRGCPDRETMNDLLGHLAAAGMMGSFGLATTNGGLPSSASSYDATPLPLPSSMRHIKPEPSSSSSSELADQVVDLGLPAPGAGSFGSASTPRLPSLPYLTGYEGMPMPLGQMIQLQPPSLQGGMPAQQQQQGGAADEGERKSGQFSQSDIDTNKLYNEIFASWPYDNLNNSTNGLNNTSLSQSQSQSQSL